MAMVQIGTSLCDVRRQADGRVGLEFAASRMTPFVPYLRLVQARELVRFLTAARKHFPAEIELNPWKISLDRAASGRTTLRFTHMFDAEVPFSIPGSYDDIRDIAECIKAELL